MKRFISNFTDVESFISNKRAADFNNLLKILKREKPIRPTLFEYFLNSDLYNILTKDIEYDNSDPLMSDKKTIDAFKIAGYDYVTLQGSDFSFMTERYKKNDKKSVSMNEGAVIFDRESFDKYEWPDPDSFDYSKLEKLQDYLPEGMKIIISDTNGILEQVINLVGYDNLCFILIDDTELAKDIFNQVGSRFVRYHEICTGFNSVGAHIFGDDWGFNSQTLISPDDLRKYVIPWHKKVETVHATGKPAILHSCGKLDAVMDDIIYDIKYDAKHSFEDKIQPVEKAYEQYGNRISILGGLDVDFISRSNPEDIYKRAVAMLEMTGSKGYALGSGNSIPDYIPMQNYFAMISAAVFNTDAY